MDKDNYLTPTELRLVADLCETLDTFGSTEISVGNAELFDPNGESIGFIRLSGGDACYVYYATAGDDDV